jgi:hypothetical protein
MGVRQREKDRKETQSLKSSKATQRWISRRRTQLVLDCYSVIIGSALARRVIVTVIFRLPGKPDE